jgi:Mg-chelatase subunit ChlD
MLQHTSQEPSARILRLILACPKPLFFGICGAVGCCLSACLLGELLWRLLEPPPPVPPPAPPPPLAALRLATSPSVIVDQGGTNQFELRLARDHFDALVAVRAVDPPGGLAFHDILIPPEQSAVQCVVAAAKDMPPGNYGVQFVATAEGLDTPNEGEIEVIVREPPRPKAALRLATSPAVQVEAGGRNRFHVTIARDFFEGPVLVRAVGLPPGVQLEPMIIPADQVAVELEVETSSEVPPGKQRIAVEALFPAVRTSHETDSSLDMDGDSPRTPPLPPASPSVDKGSQRNSGLPDRSRAGEPSSENLRTKAEVEIVIHAIPRARVDVLFVLDITGSMQWAIDGIRDGINSFVQELTEGEIDARVGLVAFRDNSIGEFAEVIRFRDAAFTSDPALFRSKIAALVANGGGDNPESSLDALALAGRQSFRPDATRVLLLVTDAAPRVPDSEVNDVAEVIARLKRARIDQVHLVIDAANRADYAPIAEVFRGAFFDLREAATGRKSFASIMPGISREIVRITVASQPATSLEPAIRPIAPAAAVAPAGALPPAAAAAPPPPPPQVVRSVQASREFSADASGQLIMAVSLWTASLAGGVIVALIAAQNLYVANRVGTPSVLLFAAIGGLAAGAIGGALSQAVFSVSSLADGHEAIGRIVGWAVLGSLVGLGMTRYVPNVRWVNGLVGGAIGGGAGAVAFLLLVSLAGAADQVGRLIGSLALGFALGLLVGLAERAFRSAWLEICYGRSEVRQVNLGDTPITFGSDRQQAMCYVQGAAPLAWRYWLEGNQCFREECQTKKRCEVFPGDEYSVGNITVSLRTSRHSRSVPAVPPRPPAPPPPPPPCPPSGKSATVGPQPSGSESSGCASSTSHKLPLAKPSGVSRAVRTSQAASGPSPPPPPPPLPPSPTRPKSDG